MTDDFDSPSAPTTIDAEYRWLVTGAAGFIGSRLVETLLRSGQQVVGLDNFSTGKRWRIDAIRANPKVDHDRFRLIEGDVRDPAVCADAVDGIDYVLHQAALASVPQSFAEPLTTQDVNVRGTANLLEACRGSAVKRFVFASSSAVYGDSDSLPQTEDRIGRPLSPYASSKLVNEIDASLYHRLMGVETVGLRYFNVYGPGQDPAGAYAAVIPHWVRQVLRNEPAIINGSADITRDFCFVGDVARANILAATSSQSAGDVFNIASGKAITLGELFESIRAAAEGLGIPYDHRAMIGPPRQGDILKSEAAVEHAKSLLGFEAQVQIADGIRETVAAYARESTPN